MKLWYHAFQGVQCLEKRMVDITVAHSKIQLTSEGTDFTFSLSPPLAYNLNIHVPWSLPIIALARKRTFWITHIEDH